MEHATTVLIADSAEDFCSSLSAALRKAEGFQVVGIANDGEQAIRMIQERRPDILVLDLMLAKQDGISVLKAIAGMENAPTVFIVSQRTSSIMHADQILVLEDGVAEGLGTHAELLENCEVYREIYDSQFKAEEKG